MSDNSVVALSEESQPSKALNVTLWILQALATAAFLMAGATKLAGAEMHVATFEKIGLGQWLRARPLVPLARPNPAS